MAQKKFQELHLKDAFLFAAALSDEDTCRMLLELILGEPVNGVTVHAEHTSLFSSDYRSIRLDIYAQAGTEACYDVEMQGEDKGNLPKRSRYYQAQMDVTSLKPGTNFNELRECYVIFLCTFDPFNMGLYRYTFENSCRETGQPLEDGTKKIFLNTKGKNDQDEPAALREFLHYVENSTEEFAISCDSPTVKLLHKKITVLKQSREWERRYMTIGDLLDDARSAALQESQQRFTTLIKKMSESGEVDKLPLLSDPAFLEEMYQKYQLSISI